MKTDTKDALRFFAGVALVLIALIVVGLALEYLRFFLFWKASR